jgi:hypothetical protein
MTDVYGRYDDGLTSTWAVSMGSPFRYVRSGNPAIVCEYVFMASTNAGTCSAAALDVLNDDPAPWIICSSDVPAPSRICTDGPLPAAASRPGPVRGMLTSGAVHLGRGNATAPYYRFITIVKHVDDCE